MPAGNELAILVIFKQVKKIGSGATGMPICCARRIRKASLEFPSVKRAINRRNNLNRRLNGARLRRTGPLSAIAAGDRSDTPQRTTATERRPGKKAHQKIV